LSAWQCPQGGSCLQGGSCHRSFPCSCYRSCPCPLMSVPSVVCMAGAWSEEPLGGLKSWPTSHDATPRSPNICGRHGIVSCAFTAARGAMPLPALGLKSP
jgi:hypothetical protein